MDKKIQKLLENYEIQKKDYQNFIKSDVWNKILNKSFYDLDIEKLKNFFSNDLSDGIANPGIFTLKATKEKFFELCEKYEKNKILESLVEEKNNIGNYKNFYSYQGKIVTNADIDNIHFYFQLERYFKKDKNIILEIGGGWGGLARIISKNFKCTYILIDLPEINLISSYYLTSHYPNKKFLFYSEFKKDDKINLSDFDFVILPPLSSINNIKYDFCINIRSMMEMNEDSIKQYFKEIQSNLSENGYFLNVNRYFSSDNKYNFYFYKFPYDKKWKIVKSETSWLQKNIHLLLTKRTKENFHEIENLFKKLEIFTTNRLKYKKNIYYRIKIFIKNLFK